MGIYWTKKKFLSILLWNMVWVCIYNFIAHRLWKIFWKRKADIICPYFKLKPNTSALWNGHMIYRPKNVFSALLLLAKCTWVASKILILIFNKMFKTFHALTKVFDKNQLMLFFIHTSLREALHKWCYRITTWCLLNNDTTIMGCQIKYIVEFNMIWNKFMSKHRTSHKFDYIFSIR